jgi:hypothetical protein
MHIGRLPRLVTLPLRLSFFFAHLRESSAVLSREAAKKEEGREDVQN